MKYIRSIIGAGALLLTATLSAQTIDMKTTANFSMKAHTTVGYDFQKNQSGIETQFDQIQVWFEIFPYGTYGLTPRANAKGLNVSIRAEGLKYAFKWFDSTNSPKDHDAVSTGKHIGDYTESPNWNSKDEYAPGENASVDRLVAEVTYGNYYFSIADTDDPIWFSDASMSSIFTELEKKSGSENVLSFPITNFTRDGIKTTIDSFNVSGILTGGCRFDNMKASLKVASKGTWDTNTNNAWVFGGSAEYKPLDKLTFAANGLGTLNYSFTEGTTSYHDIYQGGIKAEYAIDFTDMYVLKPYVGFDGEYTQDAFKWEVGGGATFYWRGDGYATTYDPLSIWGLQIPVGCSLYGLVNDRAEINAALSLFEDSADGGLIPHVGGFIEAEGKNIASQNNKDHQFGVASQIEYRVSKKIRPYIFCEWLQGYSAAGKLTGTDELDSALGVLFTPAAHFTIDVKYAREDTIGENGALDNGLLTTKCTIKL